MSTERYEHLGEINGDAYFDRKTGEIVLMEDEESDSVGDDFDGDDDYDDDDYDDDEDVGDEDTDDPSAGDDEAGDDVDGEKRRRRRARKLRARAAKLDAKNKDAPGQRRSRKMKESSWHATPLGTDATSTAAGTFKATLTLQYPLYQLKTITMEGTDSDVRITSIKLGPDTVWESQGNRGAPASFFAGSNFSASNMFKGKKLSAGQQIVVTGTATAADQDLVVNIQGWHKSYHGACG